MSNNIFDTMKNVSEANALIVRLACLAGQSFSECDSDEVDRLVVKNIAFAGAAAASLSDAAQSLNNYASGLESDFAAANSKERVSDLYEDAVTDLDRFRQEVGL
jgi:hypothetical protein